MAWLLSYLPELRAMAIDDLLAREEDFAPHFKGILEQLYDEKALRIAEVEAASARRRAARAKID